MGPDTPVTFSGSMLDLTRRLYDVPLDRASAAEVAEKSNTLPSSSIDGKYSRLVALVATDGENLSDLLLSRGLTRSCEQRKRDRICCVGSVRE